MKTVDPIIEEIRAFREALAKECDYDIEKIGRALDDAYAKTGKKSESRPAKRIAKRAS